MRLTIYQKELRRLVAQKFGRLPADRLLEELCRIGVVDHTLCKVLTVRTWVDEQLKSGHGKLEAMWLATDHFCCTFEYVRKCLYYYQDVNL
jgi:hypothetical protein